MLKMTDKALMGTLLLGLAIVVVGSIKLWEITHDIFAVLQPIVSGLILGMVVDGLATVLTGKPIIEMIENDEKGKGIR